MRAKYLSDCNNSGETEEVLFVAIVVSTHLLVLAVLSEFG